MTLADLSNRRPARIAAIDPDAEFLVELMQLGLVPGTPIEVIRRAPLGCPLEVDVTGARLALRTSVAAAVQVELL